MRQVQRIVLANIGNIYNASLGSATSTTLTAAFAGGIGAQSFEYQLSTTSPVAGFGAWAALATTNIISGLSSSTQYWARFRSARGLIRGPSSAPCTGTTAAGGGGYTGPGDLQTFIAWYGLRKYNNAFSGSGIQIALPADAATQDIGFNSDGTLDTSAIAIFLGASVGTIRKFYDQTGNAHHLTNATESNRSTIDISGTPYADFTNGSTFAAYVGDNITQSQPVTFSSVAWQAASVNYYGALLWLPNGGAGPNLFLSGTSGNIGLGNRDVTGFEAAGSTSAWLAIQAVMNGASSDIFINSSRTTGDSGSGNANGNVTIGASGNASIVCRFREVGSTGSALSNADEAAMENNQRTFWSF